MVDKPLYPAIRAAIKMNELGDADPYALSFARRGQSGASFGIFQGDTNSNPLARAHLAEILAAAGVDAPTASRLVAALGRPLPDGNPLTPADTGIIARALAAPAGRALVDQMDDHLMANVLDGIDRCILAATPRPIEPRAQLYLALWINMTGAPNTLDHWLGGNSVEGLAPPADLAVTQDDLERYLRATLYFRENPRNFSHLQAAASAGAALLPALEMV